VSGAESIRALVFTVNRECSGYAGELPDEVMVQALSSASGRFGPAHDYLFKTTETLREHGIRDARVEHLTNLVKARLATV
jgi:cation transport protein ChaC